MNSIDERSYPEPKEGENIEDNPKSWIAWKHKAERLTAEVERLQERDKAAQAVIEAAKPVAEEFGIPGYVEDNELVEIEGVLLRKLYEALAAYRKESGGK